MEKSFFDYTQFLARIAQSKAYYPKYWSEDFCKEEIDDGYSKLRNKLEDPLPLPDVPFIDFISQLMEKAKEICLRDVVVPEIFLPIIFSLFDEVQEKFKQVNFFILSKEQLFELGFREYDDLLLIPLYLLACIPDGTVVTSISGSKKVIGIDEIDPDMRGGCVAYGIILEKEKTQA